MVSSAMGIGVIGFGVIPVRPRSPIALAAILSVAVVASLSGAAAAFAQTGVLHLSSSASLAGDSGNPDCDNDGDAGTDPNEFTECSFVPQQQGQLLSPQEKKERQADVNRLRLQSKLVCYAVPALGVLAIKFKRAAFELAVDFGKLCSKQLAKLAYNEALVRDPPDARYLRIVAASTKPEPVPFRSRACRLSGVEERLCLSLGREASRYLAAATWTAEAFEAEAVSTDRYVTAVADGENEAAYLQRAAAHVYQGLLATAMSNERAAGRRLGESLAKVGFPPSSKLRVKIGLRIRRLVAHPPRKFSAQLEHDGFSSSEIHALLKSTLDPRRARLMVGAFRRLGEHAPTAALTRSYSSIGPLEVAFLVGALTRTHNVGFAANVRLNDDLQNLAFQCGATERVAAARQFESDAEADPGGKFGALLDFAAKPLVKSAQTRASC